MRRLICAIVAFQVLTIQAQECEVMNLLRADARLDSAVHNQGAEPILPDLFCREVLTSDSICRWKEDRAFGLFVYQGGSPHDKPRFCVMRHGKLSLCPYGDPDELVLALHKELSVSDVPKQKKSQYYAEVLQLVRSFYGRSK